MADILKYRFPNKEIVEETGFFREVSGENDLNGFIVSTFLKDQYYQFIKVDQAIQTLHFSIEKPYIVSKSEYLSEASSFLEAFEKYKIQKAVFSRIKAIEFDHNHTYEVFTNLCQAYPKAFVYLISSEIFGTWIGASPEILLSTVNKTGFTIALAGTLSINSNENWTNKEIIEQALVTDFVEEKLTSLVVLDIEKNGPYEIEAGPVKHLRTDFSFDLQHQKPFEIAKKLHPTPAVSGLPQKTAIDLINFREPHERLLYTGMIGQISQEKTLLYVNLRCCQIQKGTAYLYLGGGFTPDSNVDNEWEETENKSLTLMQYLK